MKQIIQNYLFTVNDSEVFAFQCGYLTGALVALLFVLLLGFLPRSAKGVTLRAPHGKLLISATAIADLIKALGAEFNDIDIVKVNLYHEKKGALRLYISLIYFTDGDSMLKVAESFQNRVLEALKHNFGIENIHNIELHVRKSKTKTSF